MKLIKSFSFASACVTVNVNVAAYLSTLVARAVTRSFTVTYTPAAMCSSKLTTSVTISPAVATRVTTLPLGLVTAGYGTPVPLATLATVVESHDATLAHPGATVSLTAQIAEPD